MTPLLNHRTWKLKRIITLYTLCRAPWMCLYPAFANLPLIHSPTHCRQACVCCWPPTHNQPFSSWPWLGFAGWTKYLQYCRVADECCWKSRVLESSVAGRSSPRSRRLRSMAATAPEGLRQPKDPLAPLHHLLTSNSSYHQRHQSASASSAYHSTNKNKASGKELSYNFHFSLLLSFLYLLPFLRYQSWNSLWIFLCLGKVF